MSEVDWNEPPRPGPALLHRWLGWPVSVRILCLAVHATLLGLSLLAFGVRPLAGFLTAWITVALMTGTISAALAAHRRAWTDPAREQIWLAVHYAAQGLAWTVATVAILVPVLVGLSFSLWGLFSLPLLVLRPR